VSVLRDGPERARVVHDSSSPPFARHVLDPGLCRRAAPMPGKPIAERCPGRRSGAQVAAECAQVTDLAIPHRPP
jgi:hypothetical protein